VWKVNFKKFKNFVSRREICAAWSVLRDRCNGKRFLCFFSSNGNMYIATHPAWDILQAQESAELYAPATASPKITLGIFMISGASVIEFTS
jgi:hypothetical protein